MMLHMNLDACTGCGVCIGACPAGAMCLVTGKAVVNTEFCTVCRTCIGMCPTGAVMVVTPPAHAALTAVPRPPAAALPSQKQEAAPGGIALWTGIALALAVLGRCVHCCAGTMEQQKQARNAIANWRKQKD